jgi:hypothetical protein
MQSLQEQLAADAAMARIKPDIEAETERAKVIGTSSAATMFNSMQVAMNSMSRHIEGQSIVLSTMVTELKMIRESVTSLSQYMEASTNQTAELLQLMRYNMGSSSSTDVGTTPARPKASGSIDSTKDSYLCAAKIVNKYDVVACVIYRLVMLAKACHDRLDLKLVDPSVIMSVTYTDIKKIVKPVATAEFYNSRTRSLAAPVSIPEKAERGTRKALNILSDSSPETHCQVTLADMRDLCKDPDCGQLLSATMEVASRIYEVRGILCPVAKAYCGSLGRYPQFGGESGESLVLDPEPLRLARQDGPFEKKVRDAKTTIRDAYIRDFLRSGPTDAMRKLRFDMYKPDNSAKTQQSQHQP